MYFPKYTNHLFFQCENCQSYWSSNDAFQCHIKQCLRCELYFCETCFEDSDVHDCTEKKLIN